MLRKDAKVDLIRRAPLFEHCSARELSRIASLANEYELPAGRTLTAEGAPGSEFMVIVEGAAEVRRKGRKVNTLRAGDFLGEIALVLDRGRTATVTTTETSRLLVINARPFRRLMREVPSLQMRVIEALAARLSDD
jgi:CRP-like cAMP-binding protein